MLCTKMWQFNSHMQPRLILGPSPPPVLIACKLKAGGGLETAVPLHDIWWLSCSCQGDSVCCLGYQLSCPGPGGLRAHVPALSWPWAKKGRKEIGSTPACTMCGDLSVHVIWANPVSHGYSHACWDVPNKPSQVADSTPEDVQWDGI